MVIPQEAVLCLPLGRKLKGMKGPAMLCITRLSLDIADYSCPFTRLQNWKQLWHSSEVNHISSQPGAKRGRHDICRSFDRQTTAVGNASIEHAQVIQFRPHRRYCMDVVTGNRSMLQKRAAYVMYMGYT